MQDKAHTETDEEIQKIQRHLSALYSLAQAEISVEMSKFAKTIQKQADVLMGEIRNAKTDEYKRTAEKAYKAFFVTEVLSSKEFKKMVMDVSERLYEANKSASDYINTKTAYVYAINYNQFGEQLQKELDGYNFQLVTEEDVELFGQTTKQNVDKDKDTSWNNKNVHSAILSGALLAYSAKKIFSDASKSVTQKNKDGANRQASDNMTDAENKGRLDSLYRASDEGFDIQKYWKATLDNRTRDSHRKYDTLLPQELDYEYNTGLKKPRDPDCPYPEEICNCRCRILYTTGRQKSPTRSAREGEVTGSYKKNSSFRGTKTVSVPNMNYREWMSWRSR